ncbi:MAG: site-2 protease family protein [Deltaproteobacteria bacterium]|nr:site-2 protease family protein [Deltaproteobacteria bacterium]
MPPSNWPVPFILDPQHLAVDAVVSFAVSVLLAITINAEAQAFIATFLGDSRTGDSRRFNFNCLLHLSLLGTICYLVAGFGWPRTVDIDPGKFKHPRAYLVITRMAGPIANLLLASIVGSIVMIMMAVNSDPRVFLMVIGVNVTTAIYNLIILPPLAAGILVSELLPPGFATLKHRFLQVGPFLILALAFLERLSPEGIVSPYLNPIIVAIFNYIRGS